MAVTKLQAKEIADHLAAKILYENRLLVEFDISDPEEEESIRIELEAIGKEMFDRQGSDPCLLFFTGTIDGFIAFVKGDSEGGSDGSN